MKKSYLTLLISLIQSPFTHTQPNEEKTMLKKIADCPRGIYQHYKGQYYEVIDTARSSETLEDLVIYRALYGEFDLWVRPLQMFMESIEHNGVTMPRFKFISPENAQEFSVNRKV